VRRSAEQISAKVREVLRRNIEHKLKLNPVKVRADFDATCFGERGTQRPPTLFPPPFLCTTHVCSSSTNSACVVLITSHIVRHASFIHSPIAGVEAIKDAFMEAKYRPTPSFCTLCFM
jgi:hypothetical protein